MMWMTGTNALNFLMFVGIAIFPAVCPAWCYYRATFPGGGRRLNSCFLACPPKRIKVKDSEGRDVLKGKACESGSKPSWRSLFHAQDIESGWASEVGSTYLLVRAESLTEANQLEHRHPPRFTVARLSLHPAGQTAGNMAIPTNIRKLSALVPVIHIIIIASSESGLSHPAGSWDDKSISPSESEPKTKCGM